MPWALSTIHIYFDSSCLYNKIMAFIFNLNIIHNTIYTKSIIYSYKKYTYFSTGILVCFQKQLWHPQVTQLLLIIVASVEPKTMNCSSQRGTHRCPYGVPNLHHIVRVDMLWSYGKGKYVDQ